MKVLKLIYGLGGSSAGKELAVQAGWTELRSPDPGESWTQQCKCLILQAEGGGDEKIIRSSGPAHLVRRSASNKGTCLRQGRRRVRTDTPSRPLASTHAPRHTHTHIHRLNTPPTQNISFSVSWLLLLIIMVYQVIPQLPICTKRKVVFLLHFPWKQDLVFKCHAFLTLPWHRWWTEPTERGNQAPYALTCEVVEQQAHTGPDDFCSTPMPSTVLSGPHGWSRSFVPPLRMQPVRDMLTLLLPNPRWETSKSISELVLYSLV